MSTQRTTHFIKTHRKAVSLLMVLVCALCLIANLNLTFGKPDQATFSPSAYENNEWTNPTAAYSSDNIRATETGALNETTYLDFSVQATIDDADTINQVYLKAEGYVTNNETQQVYSKYSIDGGSTWTPNGDPNIHHNWWFGDSETVKTWNVTDDRAWTPQMLNDTNFRFQFQYYATGGCYPNETFYISYDEKLDLWKYVNIEKTKLGDSILVYNDFTGEIELSTVAHFNAHFGEWVIRDIYSGEISVTLSPSETWTWLSHIRMTDNHPVAWSYDAKGTKEEIGFAQDLKAGYYLSHLFHDEPYFRNEEVALSEHYIKRFPITRIVETKQECFVYNIKAEYFHQRPFLKCLTKAEIEDFMAMGKRMNIDIKFIFDPPPISVVSKDTGYLDHASLEIHYTPAGAWNFVEAWSGEFLTRSWAFVEAWSGNLLTRSWAFVESWDGNFLTRSWNFVEFWSGNFLTRSWNFVEFWSGEFKTRSWAFVESWSGNLFALELIDSYNWSVADNIMWGVWDKHPSPTGRSAVGQTFESNRTYAVAMATFWIKDGPGIPKGELVACLYRVNRTAGVNGYPLEPVLATSEPITVEKVLPDGAVVRADFMFNSSQQYIMASGNYSIALQVFNDTQLSTSNYFYVMGHWVSPSGLDDGNYFSYGWGSWGTVQQNDVYFQVWGYKAVTWYSIEFWTGIFNVLRPVFFYYIIILGFFGLVIAFIYDKQRRPS